MPTSMLVLTMRGEGIALVKRDIATTQLCAAMSLNRHEIRSVCATRISALRGLCRHIYCCQGRDIFFLEGHRSSCFFFCAHN